MINSVTQTVIVRIPVEQVVVNINGENKKVYQFTEGFSLLEYDNGEVYPTSNPIQQWFIDTVLNGTDIGQRVFFQFEAQGERGNPSLDDKPRSLSDIQIGMG